MVRLQLTAVFRQMISFMMVMKQRLKKVRKKMTSLSFSRYVTFSFHVILTSTPLSFQEDPSSDLKSSWVVYSTTHQYAITLLD